MRSRNSNIYSKYRKKLLVFSGNEVKQVFEGIATRSDFAFEALEVDQDHIHYLVKSEPRMRTSGDCTTLAHKNRRIQLWQKHEDKLKRDFWRVANILE